MPVITRATSRVATIVEEGGIEITRTSALIGTLRVITVRGWATGRCTAATIAKGSKMATKMGIEGIKPLESIWIEWSPIARSGSFDLQVGFSDRGQCSDCQPGFSRSAVNS